MVVRGINEQNMGLAERVGNIKLIFPPSYAAEAVIGLAGPEELKYALGQLNSGPLNGTFPTLSTWSNKENGVITWEDLEAKVRTHSEGMAHLLNSVAIKDSSKSTAGVAYYTIKKRGDARTGETRSREVRINFDEQGKVVDIYCTCPQFKIGVERGNLASGEPFSTQVACYHIEAALISEDSMPYNFDDMNVVFESLAMKVFKKSGDKSFLRDLYLLDNDVLTESSLRRIADGESSVEVIWNRRNIRGLARAIMERIGSYLEKKEYEFSGFALDFPDTPFQTTGVVYTKGDGKSVHILYDEILKSGDLPFVMLKIPRMSWLGDGKDANLGQLVGNPVQFSQGKRYFDDFDIRTQSDVVAIVSRPPRGVIIPIEEGLYDAATAA